MTDYRKRITDTAVLKELDAIDQAMSMAMKNPDEPTRKECVRTLIQTHISKYQQAAATQPIISARVQPVLAELERLLAEADSIGKTSDQDDEYQG